MKPPLQLIKFVFVILAVIILYPLNAQVEPENIEPNWEVWYEKVPVSGEIRVGIMEDVPNVMVNPDSFYVMIPNKKYDYLCVEMSSRDGRYNASLEYNMDSLKIGSNCLLWPTDHSDDLKDYKKQDLTILSNVGDTCDDDPKFYTLASWVDDFSSDTLFILLNSEKAPTIKISDRITKVSVDIECEKLKLSTMITYNCKCAIPKNSIAKNSELQIVKRVRKVNKITFKRYPLPIKLDR